MAICEFCKTEMLDHKGCTCERLFNYDDMKYYDRIKVGDPNDLLPVKPGEFCHDCGAPYGAFHHPGCDSERCPRCGEQLFICECDIDIDLPIVIKRVK